MPLFLSPLLLPLATHDLESPCWIEPNKVAKDSENCCKSEDRTSRDMEYKHFKGVLPKLIK